MSNGLRGSSSPFLLVGGGSRGGMSGATTGLPAGRTDVDAVVLLSCLCSAKPLRKIAVARFCRTLATLLVRGCQSGRPDIRQNSGKDHRRCVMMVTRRSIERGEAIDAP